MKKKAECKEQSEFEIPAKGVEKIKNSKLEVNHMAAENQKVVLVTQGDAPNVELGIDAVKKIVKAIKEIEEARAIIMADGKVSIGDFTGHPLEVVWEPAKALYDVVREKDLILAQIVRIDTNEAEELIAEVAKEFNMLPGNVSIKIGHAIKAAWHIGEIFKN